MAMQEHVTEPTGEQDSSRRGIGARFHWGVVVVLNAIMAVELVGLVAAGQWLNTALVIAIMALALLPILLRDRLPIRLPPEFQVMAILFVFAALFLGEVRSYYDRIWWWDLALHASSGLLLGLLGLMLVYILNERPSFELHLAPHFIALFAFVFAVSMGTLWEIFEFAVDGLFGSRMQKPMLSDPSGLSDTMWDLIVNTLAALIVALLGWWSLRRGGPRFVANWIARFRRLPLPRQHLHRAAEALPEVQERLSACLRRQPGGPPGD